MAEHIVHIDGVVGSSPTGTTTKDHPFRVVFFCSLREAGRHRPGEKENEAFARPSMPPSAYTQAALRSFPSSKEISRARRPFSSSSFAVHSRPHRAPPAYMLPDFFTSVSLFRPECVQNATSCINNLTLLRKSCIIIVKKNIRGCEFGRMPEL